ncbi:DUF2004 domain-containing protein [Pseudenhygromyxa sp. WMMC2535]|uniref:DUF2004 domain-containing protein n=1 Tax=Pseudenhygromyxa sp. WMMC2535 TaxID=2712867 RepID=UPI001553C741|nr:DUF2004 domain-containing protein [Pseudenhygromyxa sp. WMMC2535]NVB36764.1 DUF2004 domain-containing protein [Pseudenhygromyxa sp. WMMC2535]
MKDPKTVRECTVHTVPAYFDAAIELIHSEKLSGLNISYDYRGRDVDPPKVDLSRLRDLSSLRALGIDDSLGPDRVLNFDAIPSLTQLTSLSLHVYPRLDVSPLSDLEELIFTDSKKLRGLDALTKLRRVRVWKLARGDLSIFAGAGELAELDIIQAKPETFTGLDTLGAVTKLGLGHCRKLARLESIPPALEDLRVQACGKLSDYAILAGHARLASLRVERPDSLAFVPTLPRLESLSFDAVADGDLSPLLESPSLRKVFFSASKHHSHTKAELCAALGDAWRIYGSGLTREDGPVKAETPETGVVIEHAILGVLEFDDAGFASTTVSVGGRSLSVHVDFGDGEPDTEALDEPARLVGTLDVVDGRAREAMLANLATGDEEMAVPLYRACHLEELDEDVLLDLFGVSEAAQVTADAFVAGLKLASMALYPGNEDQALVCDYTIGEALTRYVLAVKLDRFGQVNCVSMES